MKKIRVALADDHRLVRDGIKSLIQSFKTLEVVCEGSNGKELIGKIEKLQVPPDIALIDVSMPVMDGFETVRYIRQHHKKIKCIALSVHNDFNTVFRMIDNGAKGYLLKDNSPEYMKDTIEEVYTKGVSYSSFVMDKIMEYEKNEVERKEVIKKLPGLNEFAKQEIIFIKHCCTEDTYKTIADKMEVSERTVGRFRETVFSRLDRNTRIGIVLYAVDVGLYKPTV